MNSFAIRERNLGILQRNAHGERTIREEANAQNLTFQRIYAILKRAKRQLFEDLDRTDVSRSDVLDYYRFTEEDVLKITLEMNKKQI